MSSKPFSSFLLPGQGFPGGPQVFSTFFIIALLCGVPLHAATPLSVVYRTGFEASEGYSTSLDLVGQQGWVGNGSGGNGLGTGLMPGPGQQAYVGFTAPQAGDSSLFVYYPLNRSLTQAQFAVTMSVADSTNNQWDDFYWSVYNSNGDHLLSLDFDNYELKIYYYLDTATNRTDSGLKFTNGVANNLVLNLDLGSNRWNATFNRRLLATNQPITTTGLPLDVGDIDAVWSLYNTNTPGDNYMVFDNYQISGMIPPPQVSAAGFLSRSPVIRVTGQPNNSFAVEASTNLSSWISLKTNVTYVGSFDFVDTSATGLPLRFYRARWVP